MKEFDYTISDPLGIHARPAGVLAKYATTFKSTISIKKGDKIADTRRLMALMGLGIKSGETVTVIADGEDEATAITDIEKFLKDNNY